MVSHTVKDLATARFEFDDLGQYSLAGLTEPEQLFQLTIPGLASVFPDLRVTKAEAKHHPWVHHHDEPVTLGDAARRVRQVLAVVSPEVRESLTELSARLFTGDRAVTYADTFLGRVDDKKLAARLAEHREMSLFSEKADEAAVRIQEQIDRVAAVARARSSLTRSTADLGDVLEAPAMISATHIEELTALVAERMARLDEAIIQAAMSVDPLCYKLKRTWHRGVYRDGNDWVVPYENHLGIDSLRSFDTEREARNFREAVQVAARNQTEYRDWTPNHGSGGGGNN